MGTVIPFRPWLALLALVAIASGASLVAVDTDPTLQDILSRAGSHVRQFEQDFFVVISDESYQQKQRLLLTPAGGGVRGTSLVAGARKMRSDTLFLWIPEQQVWLTARNVLMVDGKAIPDSQDRLDKIFQDTAPDLVARLRRLRMESSRFNVGRIYRDFNDPTLALQFLDPTYQPHFTFTLMGRAKVNGLDTWHLTFAERVRPTLVTTRDGDLVSTGSVWVAVSDGAVLRTRLTLADSNTNTNASIVVTYQRDPKLKSWVPSRMDETYFQSRIESQGNPPRSLMVNERIECVATYSNFRRFEGSARLVIPQ